MQVTVDGRDYIVELSWKEIRRLGSGATLSGPIFQPPEIDTGKKFQLKIDDIPPHRLGLPVTAENMYIHIPDGIFDTAYTIDAILTRDAWNVLNQNGNVPAGNAAETHYITHYYPQS